MTKLKPFSHLGAIVLGMQDAIVSQTGIIAGLGVALSDRRLTLLTMIVAAAADALSMMAANFQAARADGHRQPIRAGLYTGASYILTAAVLILPFVFVPGKRHAIIMTGLIAALVIFGFNFFAANPRKSWTRQFWGMIAVCAVTSIMALGIGIAAEYFLGITV